MEIFNEIFSISFTNSDLCYIIVKYTFQHYTRVLLCGSIISKNLNINGILAMCHTLSQSAQKSSFPRQCRVGLLSIHTLACVSHKGLGRNKLLFWVSLKP